MERRPVLLVEDDADIAETLCEILVDEGYQVTVARHGAEALALLHAGPLPGLILLDLMMPHMDGREMRRHQLADPRLAAVPTWVITASGSENLETMGVEGWLRKPIPLKLLLALVARYCGDDPHRHVVEFYSEPRRLVENVATFLGDGLDAGESAALVAIPERWRAIEPLLIARGLDVERLADQGRLVVRDAADTLDAIRRDSALHPDSFEGVIGSLVDQAAAASGVHRVRAYGEMVDLLWRRGENDCALQLENFWNQLLDTRPIALYCSYCTTDGLAPPAVAARHTRAIASYRAA